MADAKITALTEETAPISTDIFPMVDDPAGTPTTKKVTLANIIAAIIATQAEQEAATSTTKVVTPGRQHFHPSAAKFWAQVTGAGTPSLTTNYNVTSVADTNTGRMTITIATDFSSANWCAAGVNVSTGSTVTLSTHQWVNSKAAGTIEVCNADASATPVLEDPATGYDLVGFGDQA